MTVFVILVCLIVVASVLMCFIVLIQNSKGGGLAAGFASSNQIMGVRKTTDVPRRRCWHFHPYRAMQIHTHPYRPDSVPD